MTTKNAMKTYTVSYAEDVPHHGTRQFEAADGDLAIQLAMEITPAEMRKVTGTTQNITYFRRIVGIEGPEGVIAEDIYLDHSDMPALVAEEIIQILAHANVYPSRAACEEVIQRLRDASPAIMAVAQEVVWAWEGGDLARAIRKLALALSTG